MPFAPPLTLAEMLASFSGRYVTSPIEEEDVKFGFSCGKHALDDYFARRALANHRRGIGRVFVLRRTTSDAAEVPPMLGFYTLSMANAEAEPIAAVLKEKLPRYPMPVALIGRLAVDARVQRQRLGEKLLIDALRRVVDVASIVGCTGVIADAKDEGAEAFYAKHDFVTVAAQSWPHRMFLPIGTARELFAEG